MALALKEELHRLVDEIPETNPDVLRGVIELVRLMIAASSTDDTSMRRILRQVANAQADPQDTGELDDPLPRFLAEAPDDDEPLDGGRDRDARCSSSSREQAEDRRRRGQPPAPSVNWESYWHGDAVGDLLEVARTDRRQADRIYRAVVAYSRSEQGDARKLTDRNDEWRLRVGDWRVIFTFDRVAQTLTVLGVRRRNEGTYRD